MSFCPPTLARLWALTGQLPAGTVDYNGHFHSIGLILNWPLLPRDLPWCSPTNAVQFAETYGDSVHFSFLLLDGVLSEDSPVVMTVPMATEGYTTFIVGENLRDFLALGSRRGYFFLEQLAYQPDKLLQELAEAEFSRNITNEDRTLLTSICDTFDVHPWGTRVAERLEWLKKEFYPLLSMPLSDTVL